MTIKVGVLGLGMMGKVHFDTYAKLKGARVEAVCDVDAKKRQGDIGHGFGSIDLAKRKIYTAMDELFADPSLDVIDVCMPTYLHAKCSIAAMKAGKHVICEKPMARTSAEAREMIAASKKTNRKLFLAQCIRFWPSYVKAREIVLSGQYGRVMTARFCRLSGLPNWSWQNWLQDPGKSGRCSLDLHVHDVDFIQYLFGKPKSVLSRTGGLHKGCIDHIITAYDYGKDQLITAEGAWEYAWGYPFSMTFSIAMEGATLNMTSDTKLTLFPIKGKPKDVKVYAGDGYFHELAHFIECIRMNRDSDVVSPESAMHSVRIIEAEEESARTGKAVTVRF